MQQNHRELLGGVLVFAIGLFAAVYAAFHYDIGTIRRLGPGLFPILLGASMALTGLAIIIRSAVTAIEEPIKIEWRSFIVIISSILAFALMLRPTGIIAASATTMFISTLADGSMTLARRLLISAIITAAVVLIFKMAFGMRVPLITGVIY
jgi:hypothetical protein